MNEIILEFTGYTDGAQVFRHPDTRRSIRAGRSLGVRYVKVTPDEVNYFLSLGVFRVVHNNVPPVNVARREAPKKIEPIVPVAETPAIEVPAIEPISTEIPEEKIVSYDVSLEDIETDISWMQQTAPDSVNVDEPVAAESVEEEPEQVPTAIEGTSSVSAVEKIRRGRPRN